MTPQRFRCLLANQTGYLFHEDAKRLDEAIYEFALVDDQEVPRLPPEFVVETDEVVRQGERPTFRAGGVVIVPAASLRKPRNARLLVERGDVVVHPDFIRPHPDWRYPVGEGFDSKQEWMTFLRRSTRQHRLGLATSLGPTVVLLLLAPVVLAVHGSVSWIAIAGWAGVVLYVFGNALEFILMYMRNLRIDLRARRSLESAESLDRTEADPMLMRLSWSAGHGHGPVASARLFPSDNGKDEELRVAVIGIERGMLSDDLVPVVTHGRSTQSPIIVVDDITLWPADRAVRPLRSNDQSAPA